MGFWYKSPLLAAFLVLFDQTTKFQATLHFLKYSDPADSKTYLGSRSVLFESEQIYLGLNYVRNHGASFGLFRNLPDSSRLLVFHGLTLLFVCLLIYVLAKKSTNFGKLGTFAITLMIGGAIGNFADRLAHQYVIDFIEVRWALFTPNWHYFPIFNPADVFVVFGLILLIVDAFTHKPSSSL
jgi:signal peptidase II